MTSKLLYLQFSNNSNIQMKVHNIFLAFRYEYTRKNPATAPTTIPPVVAQNAHCSKNKLIVNDVAGMLY